MKRNEQRDMKPLFVACIPAYNEESSVVAIMERTRGYVD